MNTEKDFLYHFTENYDTILKILKDGFRLSGCLEQRKGLPGELSLLKTKVSVLCLTDIRLHEIKYHSEKYGSFGIGVTKKWAQSYHAQPVIYIDKNSGLCKAIEEYFPSIKNKFLNTNKESRDEEEMFLLNLELFCKDIEYFTEREWRILPQFIDDKLLKTIKGEYYIDISNQDDIVCIIAPRKHIPQLNKDIRLIFNKKYKNENIPFPIIPYEYLEMI
ncbi:abortive infection system antitoxin AbiGi family protein [Clostridium kluyveri]|uniref:Uncharacterized protein n=1 Tax=Clostridium kluyveri TaxID=1534 RepID=A0A1L5F462_CLOKL|nr:abortive infection system antitoxin AbiGi family protein [Clostridium kluyveri]APM37742.1 hypothetical protein BS101_02765 [Clostridium kluyveri]UZQ52233.1 abortive infection system antitoxin AbiGi family protein [Clostridium kluyveri]